MTSSFLCTYTFSFALYIIIQFIGLEGQTWHCIGNFNYPIPYTVITQTYTTPTNDQSFVKVIELLKKNEKKNYPTSKKKRHLSLFVQCIHVTMCVRGYMCMCEHVAEVKQACSLPKRNKNLKNGIK